MTVTLQTTEAAVNQWAAFIKAHEKLLLVVIVAGVVIHLGDKAYTAYGQHLASKVTADTSVIQNIEKQNAESAAVLAKAIDTMNQRFTADEALIAKAKTTIIVQQQKNNAMTTSELADHWAQDLGVEASNIVANTDGTSTVSSDAAHKTVNLLDTIQPLTDQLSAKTDELTQCNTVRNDQTIQITGLKTDIAAKDKKFDDAAKQAKHDIRAAWWKGFKWGAVAGFVGGVFALHKL